MKIFSKKKGIRIKINKKQEKIKDKNSQNASDAYEWLPPEVTSISSLGRVYYNYVFNLSTV